MLRKYYGEVILKKNFILYHTSEEIFDYSTLATANACRDSRAPTARHRNLLLSPPSPLPTLASCSTKH